MIKFLTKFQTPFSNFNSIQSSDEVRGEVQVSSTDDRLWVAVVVRWLGALLCPLWGKHLPL